MVRVLEEGYIRRVECPCCNSRLQYDTREDLHDEGETNHINGKDIHYICCPICGEKVYVTILKRGEEVWRR